MLEEPTAAAPGVGIYEFTDDYSVFGYGRMPDRLPGKGEAICRIAVAQLELIASEGIPTHLRRAIPPNRIECTLARRLDPRERSIEAGTSNYVVPLHAVFRNDPDGDPERIADTASVALHSPGPAGEEFRTLDGAAELAGLALEDLERIERMTLQVAAILARRAAELGLGLLDGRVEFAVLEPGELIVVGTPGTPDDARYTIDGVHVGKQVIRDYYRHLDLEEEIRDWLTSGRPRSTWPEPPALPMGFVLPVANMYRSLCEAWTGERIWEAPSLREAVETVQLLNSGAIRW